MVRLGGMDYTCSPNESIGHRIRNMTLDDGTPIDENKTYIVAGWATVNDKATGPPAWDQVADYIKDQDSVKIEKLNSPKLIGVKDNPGIGYS